MSFSDNFTGTAGTGLGTRTGWTQLQGTADELVITASGTLGRTSTAGGKLFYATQNDGATTQSVTVDMLTAFNPGPVIFGSVSGGNLSGYALYMLSTTSVRLYRLLNGAATLLATVTTPNNIGITLSGTVNGSGNVDLTVSSGGSTLATFTDSTASKQTSGRRGLSPSIISASNGASMFDNYSDNSSAGVSTATVTATGSLGLTGSATAKAKVHGTGSGTIPLTGSATGKSKARGAASGTLGLSGSGQGKIAAHGAAGGQLGLSGSATAGAKVSGSADGAIGLGGDASGGVVVSASADGNLDLSGSAAGEVSASAPNTAEADGTLEITGTARAWVKYPVPASRTYTIPANDTVVETVPARRRVVQARGGRW